MVLRDGNKYACDSCIRGHRVSGCNHTDRELHFIAPKGRPVKQCEHCRGARKSKSHHAKCDCGGKRERNDIKLDDKECNCNLGDSCICGLKSQNDVYIDGAVSKHSTSRPHPVKGSSDGHLTTYINSNHKACHKWGTAQSHGPYPRPRLNTGSQSYSPSITGTHTPNQESMVVPHNGTRDDSHIVPIPSDRFAGPASQSLDHLPLTYFGNNLFNASSGMDSMSQSFPAVASSEGQDLYTIPSNDSVSASYLEELMSANANPSPLTEQIPQQNTPSIYRSTQDDLFDAEKASFGSHDLPLNSGHLTPDFAQPTSFTDDSNAYSAPGLTAASSTAASELGDTMVLPDLQADNLFNTSAFPMTFNYPSTDRLDTNSAIPPRNMPPPPTSNPSPQATRRSLDAQALKSLSTFPAFDNNFQGYLAVPDLKNRASSSSPSVADQLNTFAFNNNAQTSFAQPSSFQPSAAFATERPRSVTIPAHSSYSTYNPSASIDQMYPKLGQDFANAANWDPSAPAWDFNSLMPQMR